MATSFLPQNSSVATAPELKETDFFEVGSITESEKTPTITESEPEILVETESSDSKIKQETIPQEESSLPQKKRTQKVHPHPATLQRVKDPVTAQIEKIMEEGIGDAYMELTTIQKQEFKIKGEEAAHAIKLLLQTTKVKVKKVFDIILNWLKLLPGINKFFLMQEAKIKTDKILALKNQNQ